MGELLIIRLLFVAVLAFAAYFLHPFNIEGPLAAGIGVIAAIGLLSISLTVVRAVSGQLLPCVIIHLLFNGVQSVLIVAGYAGPKPEVTPEPVTSLILPLLHAFHLFI